MRERAAMVDLAAFAIFDVTGPGALDALQHLCVAQVDVPVGRVVYTPLLAENGGVFADLTIMRLAHDTFRVVTGGGMGMRDKKWFVDHLPSDGTAQLFDATSALYTLGIWGPRARDILAAVTPDDVSNEGFPFGTCRVIEIGSVRALASRISYVGELGWDLRPDGRGPAPVGRSGGRSGARRDRGGMVWRGTTGRIEKAIERGAESRPTTTSSRPAYSGPRSRPPTSSARPPTSSSGRRRRRRSCAR
jgi:glycine cleavage system aminomethyltransferase T